MGGVRCVGVKGSEGGGGFFFLGRKFGKKSTK